MLLKTTNTRQDIIESYRTPVVYDGLMADDVHYNEAGVEFIANRYYNVLINVLE